MPPSKPQSGRPRLYGSSSEKLTAFRTRQEKAGYTRKEILVTAATVSEVKALAQQEGVSPLDVYSAMVELGLSVTKANSLGTNEQSREYFGGLSGAQTSLICNAIPEHQAKESLNSPSETPIALFFKTRKEQLNAK
ncbi:MAG: hypothetical protein ACYC3W_10890 [Candidatus Nanopelagicales bacterium]